MTNLWKRFWTDESGQDLAEYAMLLALIALICIVAVTALGNGIRDTFQAMVDSFPLGGGGGS